LGIISELFILDVESILSKNLNQNKPIIMGNKSKRKLVITLYMNFPFISFRLNKDGVSPPPVTIGINWVMWLWCGLFLLTCSIVFEKFNTHFQGFEYTFILLSHISRDLSIAIISAALIAKIIEVPNFINFVNQRTVEALTNYDFLSSLNESDLDNMKKKCSKLIFEKNGKRNVDQFLNESLIEYESEITKLLLQPYHEYYKVNIYCEDVELKDNEGKSLTFMKKVSKRNFKIVNPLRGTTHVDIIPGFNMHCPDKFDCHDLVKLVKLTVTIDDSKVQTDITDQFEKNIVTNGVAHPNYNSRVNYFIQPNKNSVYPFNSELVVEIEEIRYIAHSDPIYVQRVSKPTKNFSINYTYNNDNAKLKIEGFGADANLTDGKFIKTENGNSVSFDMLSWLLPGNGILIATIPIESTTNNIKGY